MPWYKKCEVRPNTEEEEARRQRLNKEAQSKLGATLDELESLLRKVPNGVSVKVTDK